MFLHSFSSSWLWLQQYSSGIVFWSDDDLNVTYSSADYFSANMAIILFIVFLRSERKKMFTH